MSMPRTPLPGVSARTWRRIAGIAGGIAVVIIVIVVRTIGRDLAELPPEARGGAIGGAVVAVIVFGVVAAVTARLAARRAALERGAGYATIDTAANADLDVVDAHGHVIRGRQQAEGYGLQPIDATPYQGPLLPGVLATYRRPAVLVWLVLTLVAIGSFIPLVGMADDATFGQSLAYIALAFSGMVSLIFVIIIPAGVIMPRAGTAALRTAFPTAWITENGRMAGLQDALQRLAPGRHDLAAPASSSSWIMLERDALVLWQRRRGRAEMMVRIPRSRVAGVVATRGALANGGSYSLPAARSITLEIAAASGPPIRIPLHPQTTKPPTSGMFTGSAFERRLGVFRDWAQLGMLP